MSRTIERRTSPRSSPGALGPDILILDEERRRAQPARLLDISAGGALIRSDRAVAVGRQVGLLVFKVPELGWIDAEIVRSAGPNEVGVRFLSPFRPEFVAAATSHREPRPDGDALATPYLGDAVPIW